MRKPLLIIFIISFSLVLKAQKKDKTIYFGCRIKGDTVSYVGNQNKYNITKDCTFDTAPSFVGGLKAYYKFLAKNLKWPDINYDRQAKVIVSFVIEKNGYLSNIKLIRSATPEFGTEAIRVIKLSPKWKPGVINGKPVRTLYFTVVPFKIYN